MQKKPKKPVKNSISRDRLDEYLLQNGRVESRSKAHALIMAGKVFINEIKAEKPSQKVVDGARIRIKENDHPYVGRGGVKLEAALRKFQISVTDAVCLDIGASTGGFTDCLLQHGARKVIAVDVGSGQLDWKIRSDSRVVVKEKTNARFLALGDIEDEIKVDIIVMDVSFISVRLILPAIVSLIKGGGLIVVLVKPQFELERSDIGKGGIVKDKDLHEKAIDLVASYGKSHNLEITGIIDSPITGQKGNMEFLMLMKK